VFVRASIAMSAIIIIWDYDTCPTTIPGTTIARRLRSHAAATFPGPPIIAAFYAVGSSRHEEKLWGDLQECGVECVMVTSLTRKPVLANSILSLYLNAVLNHSSGPLGLLVVSNALDALTVQHCERNFGPTVCIQGSDWDNIRGSAFPMHSLPVTPGPHPVGVFWDMENVGAAKHAEVVLRQLDQRFGPITRAMVPFGCVDPTAQLPLLTAAGMTVVNMYDGTPRAEAADRELILALFEFASQHRSPSTIIVISNDQDFIRPLAMLLNRGHHVVRVIHPNPTWQAGHWRIVDYVSQHVLYPDLLLQPKAAQPPVQTPPVLKPQPQQQTAGDVDEDDTCSILSVQDRKQTNAKGPQMLIRPDIRKVYLHRLIQLLKGNAERDAENGTRRIPREVLQGLWVSSGMPYTPDIFDDLLQAGAQESMLLCDTSTPEQFIVAFDEYITAVTSDTCSEWIRSTSSRFDDEPEDVAQQTSLTQDQQDGAVRSRLRTLLSDVVKELTAVSTTGVLINMIGIPFWNRANALGIPRRKKVLMELLQEGVQKGAWEIDARGTELLITAPRAAAAAAVATQGVDEIDALYELFRQVVREQWDACGHKVRFNMIGILFWQAARCATKKGLLKTLMDRGVKEGVWLTEGTGTEVHIVQPRKPSPNALSLSME